LENFVWGIYVRFSTRGVQKHHDMFLGEAHVKCQRLLAEKVERKKKKSCFHFHVAFPHRFFFIAFLAVSLHEEPKKTDLKISKNLKQR
jgi:hypothetical protein